MSEAAVEAPSLGFDLKLKNAVIIVVTDIDRGNAVGTAINYAVLVPCCAVLLSRLRCFNRDSRRLFRMRGVWTGKQK